MRIPLFFLPLLLCASGLSAGQIQIPGHNFTIEIPADWGNISPHPPQVLVAARSADNTRRIIVIAAKFPENERTAAVSDMRAGVKSLASNGGQIGPEKPLTIGGLPFISFAVQTPKNETITAYTTAAGDEVYMIQSSIRGLPADNDQELRSIVQSFRLITPAQAFPVNTSPRTLAYSAGFVFGRIMYFAPIPAILLVIWLIVRARSRRRGA